MLKKRIKYEDFDGNMREEDFYFNFTRSELAQLELSVNGGVQKMLDRMVQEQDVPKIAEWFKSIMLMAYGVKSEDGKRFIKSEAMAKSFSQTNAFDELYMEMLSDPAVNFSNFINAVIPKVAPPQNADKAAMIEAAQPGSKSAT